MKKTNKQIAMTNLLIFIAVVVVINLISLNVFFRLDFSKGKIYSLSPASKTALSQLDDRVIVRAYFSDGLPPDLANIRRYTKDLLEEYKTYSRGNLRYEFIDPKDDKLKEEAQRNGVPPVNVNVREKDRVEVRQVYLGLVFQYEDRSIAIPLVQETRGLEYEITKTISQIASLGMSKVGFFSLEPELPDDPRMRFFFQQQDNYRDARESIRQNYELVQTDLFQPISDDIGTLVFTGAIDSLEMIQLYNLDQFLMHGKSILVFQDRVNADIQNQTAQPINSNVFDLLSHYGVRIRENLIMDMESFQINVTERRGIFSVNTPMAYPFLVRGNTVNRHHPIVSQLSGLQFIFVSEIDGDFLPEDVRFTPLLFSSNNSGTMHGPNYFINVQQFSDRNYINRLNEQSKTLAGLYEGSFVSYFAERNERFSNHFMEYTNNGRIIVLGDMDFITTPQGGRTNQTNIDFLMNAVDYLSNNTGLIALRSREVINKPLLIERIVKTDDLTPEGAERRKTNMRELFKYINIILPALLVIVYGLLKYRSEINRRKRIKDNYE